MTNKQLRTKVVSYLPCSYSRTVWRQLTIVGWLVGLLVDFFSYLLSSCFLNSHFFIFITYTIHIYNFQCFPRTQQQPQKQQHNQQDKVAINALSMIAEDYADRPRDAARLYGIVQDRLRTASPDQLLPVIYVLDSVLKNARGCFLQMVEQDAAQWMPTAHARLQPWPSSQQNLQRVWRTWNQPFKLFDVAAWRAMGRCFTETNAKVKMGGSGATTAATNATQQSTTATTTPAGGGTARTADGTLILSKKLREEMQNMLDDMQEGLSNELDKVSLERLADVNPDLLANIRAEAERAVFGSSNPQQPQHHRSAASQQRRASKNSDLPPFLTDPRSERVRRRAEEWVHTTTTATEDVAPSLGKLVVAATADDAALLYTQSEALQMTRYLAVAVATQRLLTATIEQTASKQASSATQQQPSAQQQQQAQHSSSASFAVDPAQFTNDGIKRHNAAAVAWLYEIGLPFQSRADGRRFRTQLALSQHLDLLFRRKQQSKQQTAALAGAERGWYLFDKVWTREETAADQQQADAEVGDDNETDKNNTAAESSTFLADEARDRCVVCGIPFRMFFDNADGDGAYRYRNCREIAVWNDDAAAAASDPQLVHGTCWSGLGQPDALTADQTLQDLLVHQQPQEQRQ